RHGRKGHLLGDEKRVWEIEAHYLAHAIASYTLILSPERIILGGGVMKQKMLFPLIRQKVSGLMNDYVVMGDMNEFITAPQLDDEQGVKGAIRWLWKCEVVRLRAAFPPFEGNETRPFVLFDCLRLSCQL